MRKSPNDNSAFHTSQEAGPSEETAEEGEAAPPQSAPNFANTSSTTAIQAFKSKNMNGKNQNMINNQKQLAANSNKNGAIQKSHERKNIATPTIECNEVISGFQAPAERAAAAVAATAA